jgi:hypothetical protein
MREGAQDLELLKMLEQQAGEETVRKLCKDVNRALRVHAGETWLWKTPKDRSTADAVRIGVLESLAEFQPGG